ncbi:hypothetical protein [Psittacicella hinzii]|uniref:Uncharacterized protein n=1 Tax=Psittacicella hinzii TaxID=2028575 RepID=A0A3A1YNK0_9GAMM|nr:hypothetical protein [Psittacicella hinzii]RIY39853.1 hypothetical protein CKF58_01420 [Psittacicella hinzii]
MSLNRQVQNLLYAPDLYRAILIELEFTVNFTNRLNFNDPIINGMFHLNRTSRTALGGDKSFNHEMLRAFRLLSNEAGGKANGTGLLVLTLSSLYASLLMANHQNRDLRHLLLMKIVTYYDYYLAEVDHNNPYQCISALTQEEMDYLAKQMQNPQATRQSIAPKRFVALPSFALTSALFKYVYRYLHQNNNIYDQQALLDIFDLYMSSFSYVAFTMGLGACYHASLRKLGLESKAPFWYFRFDRTDQQTRTLNYIVDNFIFGESAYGSPDDFYNLGRLFASSGLELHEFANTLDRTGVVGCFPRHESEKEFFSEQVARQAESYPEAFNFIVTSLEKAYARLLQTMQDLRAAQTNPADRANEPYVETVKDPELNLDYVIDLNSYVRNEDKLYFANYVYHLADIYTNCTELPDYIKVDYSSPELRKIFVDYYVDQENTPLVPAFIDPQGQALTKCELIDHTVSLPSELTPEQQELVASLQPSLAQKDFSLHLAKGAEYTQQYQAKAQTIVQAYLLRAQITYQQKMSAYDPEALEIAQNLIVAQLQKGKAPRMDAYTKYYHNMLAPEYKKGLLARVNNNVLVSTQALLNDELNKDELELAIMAQTPIDIEKKGNPNPEDIAQTRTLLDQEAKSLMLSSVVKANNEAEEYLATIQYVERIAREREQQITQHWVQELANNGIKATEGSDIGNLLERAGFSPAKQLEIIQSTINKKQQRNLAKLTATKSGIPSAFTSRNNGLLGNLGLAAGTNPIAAALSAAASSVGNPLLAGKAPISQVLTANNPNNTFARGLTANKLTSASKADATAAKLATAVNNFAQVAISNAANQAQAINLAMNPAASTAASAATAATTATASTATTSPAGDSANSLGTPASRLANLNRENTTDAQNLAANHLHSTNEKPAPVNTPKTPEARIMRASRSSRKKAKGK